MGEVKIERKNSREDKEINGIVVVMSYQSAGGLIMVVISLVK